MPGLRRSHTSLTFKLVGLLLVFCAATRANYWLRTTGIRPIHNDAHSESVQNRL